MTRQDVFTAPLASEKTSTFPGQPEQVNVKKKKQHWLVSELIVIGIFAAIVKIITLAVAFAGGGMNPLTLMLKNAIYTILLVVLLHKVRKFGALTLFTTVSALISLLLMGSGIILLPTMLVACLIAETLIVLTGGYGNMFSLLLGVGAYDLLSKGLALGLSWLVMREQPELIITATIMIVIGYAGSVLGLGGGVMFVKELRHAGIIHE